MCFDIQSQEVKPDSNLKSYYGIKAGLNITNTTQNDSSSKINYGYQLGGTITIPMSKRFSFQPEMTIQSSAFSDQYVNIYSNGSRTEKVKFRETVLQFPLNFQFSISKVVNINFGPVFGYLLKNKKTFEETDIIDGITRIYKSTENYTSNSKKFKKGIDFGLNCNITKKINAGLGYTIFIYQYQSIKNLDNSVADFSLGYSFR